MSRLVATAFWDARLQVRHGFYYAAVFVVALWLALASQLPALDFDWLLPAFVAGNLVMSAFYFVGGLVLLERAEGTLDALVVTPLRPSEYVVSKVLTLGMLALLENTALVLILAGPNFQVIPFVAGTLGAAALFTLAGFVAIARYGSINEYLMPSMLYTGALTVPLVAYVARWDHWLLYLHPIQAPLILLSAAFGDVEAWQLAYAVVYATIWIVLGGLAARRAYHHFVVGHVGTE